MTGSVLSAPELIQYVKRFRAAVASFVSSLTELRATTPFMVSRNGAVPIQSTSTSALEQFRSTSSSAPERYLYVIGTGLTTNVNGRTIGVLLVLELSRPTRLVMD